MSSSFSSVTTQFLLNGLLPIKTPWARTFYTDLEIVCPDGRCFGKFIAEFSPASFL
jgi:hypothetical protein